MRASPYPDCGPGVLLWGGGSKARVIEEMIRESELGYVKIIYDETLKSLAFPSKALFLNDVNVLRDSLDSVSSFVVCIGGEHGFARVRTAQHLERLGLKALTIIHNRSFVESTAIVGYGTQIMPCAVVHKFSVIGKYSIINTNSVIDHECVVGDGVHVMGGAAITGKVVIGDYATIGTNSTILPSLSIGEGAFVGAGAVVTKDVDPYTVVAGVPAKKIGVNELKFIEGSLIALTGGVQSRD